MGDVIFKPTDVGFVMHHGNWISQAIAWFMGSKWSHTFMVYDVSGRETYLIETSDYEVIISPLSKYLNDPNCSLEIWRNQINNEAEINAILMGAKEQFGKGYGYFQLFSMGVRRLLMRLGWRIRNFIRQGLVCVAVVLYGYTRSSVPMLAGIDAEGYDTEEFYDIVSGQPQDFSLVFKKERG